jgi:hypothetical protein
MPLLKTQSRRASLKSQRQDIFRQLFDRTTGTGSDRINLIRYTLSRDQIMTFVSGLHDVQADMIEQAVEQKQKQGFPEAQQVIDYIKGLK